MSLPVTVAGKAAPSASEPRRALLAGALALTLSGCAYRSSPFVRYSPLLLQARRAGAAGQAWLFGSVHLGLDRFYPLPPEVEQAWTQADVLAVELDIVLRRTSLTEAFARRVLLPEGQTLEDWLSPDEIRRIRNLMHFDHQDWQRLRRLQPWALGFNLYNPIEIPAGPRAALGVDLYFLRRAREAGRRIVELESPQDQIEAFAGGAMDEQLTQLRERLTRLERHERTTERIIQAWRSGDAKALMLLKREAFGDEERLPALHQRMNVTRERKMAAALGALIDQGRQVFGVVGAFHLVGPDSLPAQLRRAGLEVGPAAPAGPGSTISE